MSARRPPQFRGNGITLGLDDQGSQIRLSAEARSGHLYVSGRTGSGKSRALTSALRQDIAQWQESKCGLLLLDPHGEIVESLLTWLSRTPRYKRLPIVLIDLGRDDRLVGYSPLRMREGVSPSVIASQFVEGILHAFGQVDPTKTPTITRVLSTIMQALLLSGTSLPEVFTLLDPDRPDLRSALLAKIDCPTTRDHLERLHRLSKPRFEDEVLGPVNRLSAILKNPLLRTILGQREVGFNFDWALEQGAIVLVSLAARGRKVTLSDARLFASLMLTDLWQAAMARGKRVAGGVKPFYVYMDETSMLCTPTIAQNLDQARGFGLHFTLANQMLSQFESYGGVFGRAIMKSVIANTLNKVCFRQSTDEEDLMPLVRALFLGEFDPTKKKHEITSFQTVGHEEKERWTKSQTETRGQSEGESWGETCGASWGESDAWSTVETNNWSESESTSRTRNANPDPLGLDEESRTDGRSTSGGWSHTQNDGGSSQSGGSESTTRGTNVQHSESESHGRQQQFIQVPILEERVSGIQYFSPEEQFLVFQQQLTGLAKREALAICDGWKGPKKMRTLDVIDPYVRHAWLEKFRHDTMMQHAFWLTYEEATLRLAPPKPLETLPQSLKSYGRRGNTPSAPLLEEGGEE